MHYKKEVEKSLPFSNTATYCLIISGSVQAFAHVKYFPDSEL